MVKVAIVGGAYGFDAVFYVDEKERVCRGVGVADTVPFDGMDPLEALRRFFRGATAAYAKFEAGTHSPRMWRTPPWSQAPEVEHSPYFNSLINSIQQVEILTDALERVFRVVHPAPDTTGAYGSEIRNLLILACTEVEAQWKGVLVANGVPPAGKKGFTTNQYVMLREPLGLAEFRRALCRFPDYPELAPFVGWDPASPTQSLAWYDAYNETKHDREQNFKVATLAHAVTAVAAVEILLRAQFGVAALERHHTPSSFRTLADKEWSEAECYHGPPPGKDWTSVNYAF